MLVVKPVYNFRGAWSEEGWEHLV